MQLTKAEAKLVESCYMTLARRQSYHRTIDVEAYRIASIRCALSDPERDYSSSDLQCLLCKLVAIFPNSAREYIVTVQRDLYGLEAISTLWKKYEPAVAYSGFGCWSANSSYESVIFSLCAFTTQRENILVIPVTATKKLLATFAAQKEAAIKANSTPQRLMTVEDIGQTTIAQRRANAVDTKLGKCYSCGAPKPRKVICTVCGYRPQSSESV